VEYVIFSQGYDGESVSPQLDIPVFHDACAYILLNIILVKFSRGPLSEENEQDRVISFGTQRRMGTQKCKIFNFIFIFVYTLNSFERTRLLGILSHHIIYHDENSAGSRIYIHFFYDGIVTTN